MQRLKVLALGLALGMSSMTVQAASQDEVDAAIELLRNSGSGLVESFSDQEVKRMLKSEGYGSVSIVDPGKIRFKADGQTNLLHIHDDGDMHIYYGATGIELTYKSINEWNKSSRLSRAYLDDDMDIALETDLLSNGGINEKMVLEMVKVFTQTSVPRFVKFAREHDES